MVRLPIRIINLKPHKFDTHAAEGLLKVGLAGHGRVYQGLFCCSSNSLGKYLRAAEGILKGRGQDSTGGLVYVLTNLELFDGAAGRRRAEFETKVSGEAVFRCLNFRAMSSVKLVVTIGHKSLVSSKMPSMMFRTPARTRTRSRCKRCTY
eukprot:scaffold981_cov144-Skeletonema_menzelii.AAC.2